jgi:hypothetical protein
VTLVASGPPDTHLGVWSLFQHPRPPWLVHMRMCMIQAAHPVQATGLGPSATETVTSTALGAI